MANAENHESFIVQQFIRYFGLIATQTMNITESFTDLHIEVCQNIKPFHGNDGVLSAFTELSQVENQLKRLIESFKSEKNSSDLFQLLSVKDLFNSFGKILACADLSDIYKIAPMLENRNEKHYNLQNLTLDYINDILNYICNKKKGWKKEVEKESLDLVIALCRITSNHFGRRLYGSKNAEKAEYLLSSFCMLYGYASIEQFIVSARPIIAQWVSIAVGPDISFVSSATFLQIFTHLKHPNITMEWFGLAIPLFLRCIDHPSPDLKIIGVSGISNIIAEANPTEFRLYGDVVLEAMIPVVSLKNQALSEHIIPCIFNVAKTMNSDPFSPIRTRVFELLVNELSGADKGDRRRLLCMHFPCFIRAQGIATVQFFRQLIPAIADYLLVPNYETVSSAIELVTVLMSTCWPRIPPHMGQLFQSLSACYLNITVLKENAEISVSKEHAEMFGMACMSKEESQWSNAHAAVVDALFTLYHCCEHCKTDDGASFKSFLDAAQSVNGLEVMCRLLKHRISQAEAKA